MIVAPFASAAKLAVKNEAFFFAFLDFAFDLGLAFAAEGEDEPPRLPRVEGLLSDAPKGSRVADVDRERWGILLNARQQGLLQGFSLRPPSSHRRYSRYRSRHDRVDVDL